MTGADHYRAAEQLQQHARAVIEATQGPLAELSLDDRARLRADDLADAQVHALLALAAVLGSVTRGFRPVGKNWNARSTPSPRPGAGASSRRSSPAATPTGPSSPRAWIS